MSAPEAGDAIVVQDIGHARPERGALIEWTSAGIWWQPFNGPTVRFTPWPRVQFVESTVARPVIVSSDVVLLDAEQVALHRAALSTAAWVSHTTSPEKEQEYTDEWERLGGPAVHS